MTEDNSHIRAFIAISLPERIKFFFHDLQAQLKKSGITASWPEPATLHLTLKFLGNVHAEQVDTIKTCMKKAATGTAAHRLSSSGIGVFPSAKKARVIWSGTRGQTDILEKLADRLETILLEDLGIKKDNKKFFPHVTLARVKSPVSSKKIVRLLQAHQNFCSDDFLVSDIQLFQSELTASGAIHHFIFSAPLFET